MIIVEKHHTTPALSLNLVWNLLLLLRSRFTSTSSKTHVIGCIKLLSSESDYKGLKYLQ